MTPQDLAATFITTLRQHDIQGTLGRAIPYGQKILVEKTQETPSCRANIFLGKKGSSLVFEGDWPEEFKNQVQALWKGKAVTPRAPSTPLSPSLPHPSTLQVEHPIIYVDGSYQEQGENKVIGWAFQVYENGQAGHYHSGCLREFTVLPLRNVAGECTAALQALHWARDHGHDTVEIRFDYQGIESWATGTWRSNLPFTQAYAKAFQEIFQGLQIIWTKVKGHSGEPGNDRVDQLAREACRFPYEGPIVNEPQDNVDESEDEPQDSCLTPGCRIVELHDTSECVYS